MGNQGQSSEQLGKRAVRGRGMALAGLILGYLGLVTLVGVIAAAVIVGPDASAAECTADHRVSVFLFASHRRTVRTPRIRTPVRFFIAG